MDNQSPASLESPSPEVPKPDTSEPPVFKPPEESKKATNKLIPLLIFFLLVALGVAGYFGWQNYQLKLEKEVVDIQPEPSPVVEVDESKVAWKVFTNPDLGFSFKYPSEWGDVVEEIKDAVKEGSGSSGKTYKLSFSNRNSEGGDLDNLVFGTGQSVDFSAARGGMDTDYKGDPGRPKGVTATIWARPTSCVIPISAFLYFGRIDFNLPGSEISGVRFLLPVISQAQIEVFDVEYDSKSTEEQKELCTIENVEKEANQYLVELETRQLDDLSKKQRDIFKEILNSSKIL